MKTNLPLDEEERYIPRTIIISTDDMANPELSDGEFRAYYIIIADKEKDRDPSRSIQNFVEDQSIFEEREFRKYCTSLQEKGFLYQIQPSFHGKDSMGDFIPKVYWRAFVDYIIKEHKRADLAADVDYFFRGGDYESLKKIYQSRINKS